MLNKEQDNQHHQLLCSKLSPLRKMKRKKFIQITQKSHSEKQQLLFPIAAILMFLGITRWDCLHPLNSQDQQGKVCTALNSAFCLWKHFFAIMFSFPMSEEQAFQMQTTNTAYRRQKWNESSSSDMLWCVFLFIGLIARRQKTLHASVPAFGLLESLLNITLLKKNLEALF